MEMSDAAGLPCEPAFHLTNTKLLKLAKSFAEETGEW